MRIEASLGAKRRGVQSGGRSPSLAIAIIITLVLCLLPAPRNALAYGWLSGYDKRVILTIDKNDVTAVLANFPVLVYLSTASGRGSAQDDLSCVFDELQSDINRKKIAVTTYDGQTECYVEIEKWDHASKKAWLWVSVPTVSNTADTVLYLYYDKDQADNTVHVGDKGSTPGQTVWGTNFKGVWHLNEDPSGMSPQMKDSMIYTRDGTSQGSMTTSHQVAGEIDGSLDFEGTDDYIQTTSADSKTASALTWKCWFKADSTTFAHHLMWEGINTGNGWGESYTPYLPEMHISLGDYQYPNSLPNRLSFFFGDADVGTDAGAIDAYTDFSDTASWHYVAAVVTNIDTSPSATLYLDGASVASDTGTTARTGRGSWDTDLRFARPGTAERYFDGLLDEVRVSSTDRSAACVKASYESGRDHLIDYGSEETPSSTYMAFIDGGSVAIGTSATTLATSGGTYDLHKARIVIDCVKPVVPDFPLGAILALATSFVVSCVARRALMKAPRQLH